MDKSFLLKSLASVATIGAIVFVGITGQELVAQNAALSKQVSQLSSQVTELQKHSESLKDKVGELEERLKPRYEQLLGYNR